MKNYRLILVIFFTLFCLQPDILQASDISSATNKKTYISILYGGVQKMNYKEIDLKFNTGIANIESIDWKSFSINLRDITIDSVWNLANSYTEANKYKCNYLKSDSNDTFVLMLKQSDKTITHIIMSREELLPFIKSLGKFFNEEYLDEDNLRILERFYTELEEKE